MQLRKRKLEVPAVTASALKSDAGALVPPVTPAAVLASKQQAQDSPTPQRRKTAKKMFQDIGIQQLVLGAGQATLAANAAAASPTAAPAVPGSSRVVGLPDTRALQAACDYLAAADPALAPLIQEHGPPVRLLAKSGSCYATLAKSICFQQLATAAAAAIYGRVLKACACSDVLAPSALLAANPAELRAAGLSERKVSYLQDLSQRFMSGHLSDELIYAWDDATLHRELTKVKGIGDWSVDMFAMFHLGRADELPVGDLGVRRGMQTLYRLKELPSPADMQRLTERWKPYRSVGSYYMWRVPVNNNGGKKKAGQKKAESTTKAASSATAAAAAAAADEEEA